MPGSQRTDGAGSGLRVLLLDDHVLFRAGVRALLERRPDLAVVGEAADAEAGVALAGELAPDLALVEVGVPGCGVEASRRMRALERPPQVLVLTSRSPAAYLAPAVEAGALGFLGKRCGPDELLAAIRAVAHGEPYFTPSATSCLVEYHRFRAAHARPPHALAALSGREREVLTYVAGGFTSLEIADRLGISPKTVSSYRHRVMDKMDFHHRSELVRFAVANGMLASAS